MQRILEKSVPNIAIRSIFMPKNRLPKSIRKHIREEKAKIRRQIFDLKEQEKLISELYKKFVKNDNHDTNTQITTNDTNKSLV